MNRATQLIGLACLISLTAGCRDSVEPAAPYPGRPVASALAAGSTLFFSTYLGGTGDEDGSAITVDGNGYIYVTGSTASIDFPATAGAFRTTFAGVKDVVVSKLDPSGAGLVYSTYLGGANEDAGAGIAVDAAGYTYIAGETYSNDFPTTAGAFRATAPGSLGTRFAGFVAKLDPAGSSLAYSTYLGGSTGSDDARAIALDGAGNAYVTGAATSSDFPVTAGALRASLSGQEDGFVTELDPSGSALVYSTYLGGRSTEHGTDIAVDAAGYAYVTGRTSSSDFPVTAGAFQTTKASNGTAHAAFVSKVNPGGSGLAYSTYLGGSGSDRGVSIALDAAGNAYVTGRATSTDFPLTAGAVQTALAGGRDAYVAELNPSGSGLVYSTYLGGAADDEGADIGVDAAGNVYVAGTTESTNFPVTAGAVQPAPAGLVEAFVAKLSPSTSTLAFSTYLGGTGDDETMGVAVDAAGYAHVTGTTSSADFPTTAGAVDPTSNGLADIFVVKIGDSGQPATLALAPDTATTPVNTESCVTATVQDAAANPVPGVPVRFSVAGVDTTAGSVTTDPAGQAAFCYSGTQAGDDTITGVADTNHNGTPDAGEPTGTATRTWVVP
ncbi:MAG TPA: SBBP repeat-containing protein [Gemmatimonadales bacterium]|nr:SBBP repeat-containing protein [Gemmatimonadales bacterium]